MDAHDIFRKLGGGIKFDYKRFRDDALKFKLIKTDTPAIPPSDEVKHQEDLSGHEDQSDQEEEIDSTPKKRKLDDENGSDDEVYMFSSLPKLKMVKTKTKKPRTEQQLAKIKQEETNRFRNQNRIHIHGTDLPDPVKTFDEMKERFNISPVILDNIQNVFGYQAPTPIQMQAIAVMLERREILACAPTGSGKTCAFLLPILHHLQGPRKQGFRAVIVSPTRELAKQTYRECCRLAEGKGFRIHVIEKVGSAVKKFGPQTAQKFDILVTTPNRLVYLINQEPPVISLKNVEWLVVDESDKLFEAGVTGFRDQLGAIYKACDSSQVRRAMFSATFAFDVEEWCKLNLDNVVTVSIGARNTAVDLIEQDLVFVGNEGGKLLAFRDLVQKGLKPPVLVFVQTKERAKELFNELIYDGINVDVIHADRTQLQRDNIVKGFRCGKIWVLICTELMGRGIDFKGVNLVVNYDFPPSSISYIHRIGRTGRAGRRGKAITFFTEVDGPTLRSIAQVMKNSGCNVPDYMLQMKKQNKRVKKKQLVPERETISTVPKYIREKEQKRKSMIKSSKERKKKMASQQS